MIMAVKNLKRQMNQKGQALVEFVLFLPFLIMIYSVLMSIGNSINGSINQQKATRGYMKFRLQNNSYVPKPSWGGDDLANGMNTFGMWIIGWMEEMEGNTPVKTCYKFNIPIGESDNDECEKTYTKNTTQYIRIGTVLGVCGASYKKVDTGIKLYPYAAPSDLVSEEACQIR